MGQIRGFFRSYFSEFGAPAPNALKSDLKKPRICPIWGQSDPLWSQTYHPCTVVTFGTHFGQMGMNWEFYQQFSVHLANRSKLYWKQILKISRLNDMSSIRVLWRRYVHYRWREVFLHEENSYLFKINRHLDFAYRIHSFWRIIVWFSGIHISSIETKSWKF